MLPNPITCPSSTPSTRLCCFPPPSNPSLALPILDTHPRPSLLLFPPFTNPPSALSPYQALLAERFAWRRLHIVHSDEPFAQSIVQQLDDTIVARGGILHKPGHTAQRKKPDPLPTAICAADRLSISTSAAITDDDAMERVAASLGALPSTSLRVLVVIMGKTAYGRWAKVANSHGVGTGKLWALVGAGGWLDHTVDADGALGFVPAMLPTTETASSTASSASTSTTVSSSAASSASSASSSSPLPSSSPSSSWYRQFAHDAVWTWARGLNASLHEATTTTTTTSQAAALDAFLDPLARGGITASALAPIFVDKVVSDTVGFEGLSGRVSLCGASNAGSYCSGTDGRTLTTLRNSGGVGSSVAPMVAPTRYGQRRVVPRAAAEGTWQPMWQLMNLRNGALHAVRRVVISADTNASVAKAVWQTTNDKSDKRQDVAAATKALASTTTIGSAIDKVNLDLIDNGCLSFRGCINLNENYNTSSSVETKLAELDMLFPGIIWPDGSQQARSGLEERDWERNYERN